MRAAAMYGPLVVVNVSGYRCDAFLIREHQAIEDVALNELNTRDIEYYARSNFILAITCTLLWFWKVVARPIIDAVGYTQHIGSIHSWSRTWWIQTGLLSRY